jgi:hypothetical protein
MGTNEFGLSSVYIGSPGEDESRRSPPGGRSGASVEGLVQFLSSSGIPLPITLTMLFVGNPLRSDPVGKRATA